MIKASEARAKIRKINTAQFYLTTLNTNIKIAAGKGRESIIMEWHDEITHETFDTVVQTLLDNGYSVNTIPASHYYEYGAISIKW